MNHLFTAMAVALLVFALASTGLGQAAPQAGPQGGGAQQQQQGQRGQGQQGQRGGQGRGGRGAGNAAPAAPTPRRADGKPIISSVPGQKPGRWSGGPTTLPQGQLDQIRFTRPDMNTLQYQATIDDPGAYTKPWTTSVFTMRWAPNADAFEYICQDNNHGPELMIGSQSEVDNTRFFVP